MLMYACGEGTNGAGHPLHPCWGTCDESLSRVCNHVNASLSVPMVFDRKGRAAETHATQWAWKQLGGEGALKMRCKIVILVS